PASVRPALARYRSRADLLDPPIRLRDVIPPADTGDAGRDATSDGDRDGVSESASDTTNPPAAASESAATTAPPPLATGPVTIVHYFQNGRPASLAPLFALRNLRRAYDPERLDIVSVSLGPVLNWPEEADWPVLVSHGGSLGVEKLRVEVVPTFAVFDREGRLAIVGESSVVLEQVRAMLEQDANDTP
ncbi:MAG: TlpA family protein disulfide reductase, partial [Phycisphaeraceae bacterium]